MLRAREPEPARPAARPETPRRKALTALFAMLRAVRLRIAEKRGVPAYMIFNDATLRSMCAALPQTPEQLLEIPRRKRRQIARLWRRVSARHRPGRPK